MDYIIMIKEEWNWIFLFLIGRVQKKNPNNDDVSYEVVIMVLKDQEIMHILYLTKIKLINYIVVGTKNKSIYKKEITKV